MNKLDKCKKIYEKIANTTIAVEEYKPIRDGTDVDYSLCLFSYFFDDADNTIKLITFLKDNTVSLSEWKRYDILCTINENDYTIDISKDTMPGRPEVQRDLKIQIRTLLDTELNELYEYLYNIPGRMKMFFWVGFKDYGIEAGYEIGMFLGNAAMANKHSEKENAIKDAATRNSKKLTQAEIDKINKVKKEGDPELKLGAINTPDTVKTVLNKIGIPKSTTLTVNNIELDGAFRISYTS